MKRKFWAVLLALVMLLTMTPAAFADASGNLSGGVTDGDAAALTGGTEASFYLQYDEEVGLNLYANFVAKDKENKKVNCNWTVIEGSDRIGDVATTQNQNTFYFTAVAEGTVKVQATLCSDNTQVCTAEIKIVPSMDLKSSDGTSIEIKNCDLSEMAGEEFVLQYAEIPSNVSSLRLKMMGADVVFSGYSSYETENTDGNGYFVIGRNEKNVLLSDQELAALVEEGMDFPAFFGHEEGKYDYNYLITQNDLGLVICWEKSVEFTAITDVAAEGATLYTPAKTTNSNFRMILDKDAEKASFKFTTNGTETDVYYSDSSFNEKGKALVGKNHIYTVDFNSDELTGDKYNAPQKTYYLVIETSSGAQGAIAVSAYKRTGAVDGADSVADYFPVGSQYTNGGNTLTGLYGLEPEKSLLGLGFWYSPISLGNFGGYITYKFENPITDDEKNPYGIDFIVYGNTNGGPGFSEPGAVSVSEDGKTWYTLAGSAHYDDDTIWNRTMTYYTDEDGKNYAEDENGTKTELTGFEAPIPTAENYPLHYKDAETAGTATVSGVYLNARGSEAAFPAWGYADVKLTCATSAGTGTEASLNGEARNPYWPQPTYDGSTITEKADADVNEYGGDGFDLAWAVDENGQPVNLSNAEIKYVKVQTASFVASGAGTGEKSTEVNVVARSVASESSVGQTAAPASITVDGKTIAVSADQNVYTAEVSGLFSVKVAASEDANVYTNSVRASETVFESMPIHDMVRVVVQEGEKEPYICYLNLTEKEGKQEESATLTLDPNGGKIDDSSAAATYSFDAHMSDMSLPTPVYKDESKVFDGWYFGQQLYTTYPTAVKDITLTAKWKDSGVEPTPSGNDKIKVSFRLIGSTLAEFESDTDTIDLADGDYKGAEYVTWIATKTYTMREGDTVLDLFEKALNGAGLSWKNPSGNYIETITAPAAYGAYELSEFTNGNNSGWMYTIDGEHPNLGVAQQKLTDGDEVIFHYVDDYAWEVEDWSKLGSGAYKQLSTKDHNYWNAWLEAKNVNPSKSSKKTETTVTVVTPDTVDTTVEGLPYKDVKGHWALDSIKYAYDKGLMNGTGKTSFAPDETLNRAMLATIIYRLAGSPAVSASGNGAAYSDVAGSTWYSDAVAWASANGIVTGYTDGTFRPDAKITRQELAAMLYRYAKLTGCDVSALTDLAGYADKADIGSWALTALEWANAEKLVNGRTETTIVPAGSATRAEAATILMRFEENVAGGAVK